MAYKTCSHRLSEPCETCIKEDWRAWRDDYRCTRPAVSCDGCGTHYPRGTETGNATYIGYALKTCGECHRHNEIKRLSARVVLRLHRHITARTQTVKESKPIKEIHRDIACRYISRFDGSTFAVPISENQADIYLRNAFGLTIARVSMFDRYPKPVAVQALPY